MIRKGELDIVFKSYYRKYRTYDGLKFVCDNTIYRVVDNKRVLEVKDPKGKIVFKSRIPYINMFRKLSDALTPGGSLFQAFQTTVLEKGKGVLNISSLKFDLYKEKDSIIITRENGLEIVFDNVTAALQHVKKTIKEKLDVHVTDAEYNKGDKIILGVDPEGKEKVGTVKEVSGEEITLDIDGAEVKTTSADLNDQLEEKAEEALEDDEFEEDDDLFDEFEEDDDLFDEFEEDDDDFDGLEDSYNTYRGR